MTDKRQDIIAQLTERGYKVVDEQGVLMVLCDQTKTSVADYMTQLQNDLKDLNYDQSYGVRVEHEKHKEG